MNSSIIVLIACTALVVYGETMSNFGRTRNSNGNTEHQKCTGDVSKFWNHP